MYIADVIPFATIPRPHPQVLSYFLPRTLPKGALVEVPIGRRNVQAVVLATREASASKFEIRKSGFMLKSIRRVLLETSAYDERQIELALWISERYWAPLGKSMALMTVSAENRNGTPARAATPMRTTFIRGVDRLREYLPYIQDALRTESHALILCPDGFTTRAYAAHLESLNIGADILHCGSNTSKRVREHLAKRLQQPNALVAVGTRSALFLPWRALGLIVIEQPGAPSYEAWGRAPRYDAIETAEKLSKLHHAHIVYGDIAPTVAVLRALQPRSPEKNPVPILHPAPSVELIDLRYQKYWSSRHPLTPPIKDAVRRAIRGERPFEPNGDVSSRKQAIILLNRKGVAGALVCRACGQAARCKHCDVALVLHPATRLSETAAGILRCHHCLAQTPPPKQCAQCKSFRLWPIGTGTTQIETDIKKLIPEARVARVDSDCIKKESELEAVLNKFHERQTDIVIGTHMVLKDALLAAAAISVVVNADQFFVFPAYDAAEKAWRTLSLLRAKTLESLIIQTLDPDMPALSCFAKNNEAVFFEEEIARRKSFAHPPYGELIRLTFAHRDKGNAAYEAKKLFNQISVYLKADVLGPSPAFIPRERGKWKYVILIKLPTTLASEDRTALLEQVPPFWQVNVNPKELL